jgi:hypothetical protein
MVYGLRFKSIHRLREIRKRFGSWIFAEWRLENFVPKELGSTIRLGDALGGQRTRSKKALPQRTFGDCESAGDPMRRAAIKLPGTTRGRHQCLLRSHIASDAENHEFEWAVAGIGK